MADQSPDLGEPNGLQRWDLALLGLLVGLSTATAIWIVPAVPPDSRLPLHVDPHQFLSTLWDAWDRSEGLGRRSGTLSAYAPTAYFYAGLRSAGFSALWVHRLFVALTLAVSAGGAYMVIRSLWSKSEVGRAANSLLALLYAANPYVLLNLSGTTVLLLPYAAVPWVGLLYGEAMRRRSPTHLVCGGLVWGVLGAGVNPAVSAIALAGVVSVAYAIAISEPAGRKVGVVWPALSLATLGAASLWWAVPFFESLRFGGAEPYLLTDPIEIGASRSGFREVIRMTGLWALYQQYGGEPYYPSQGWLLHQGVVSATLGAAFAAFVGVVRTIGRLVTRVVSLMLCAAVPLAVAVYPPSNPSTLGLVYHWLYDNVFAFRAFRSNYKWVSLVALAIVLLAAASQIRSTTAGTRRLASVCLIAVMLTVFGFAAPFAARDVLGQRFRIGDVPAYWEDAGQWLDRQEGGGRVLLAPQQAFSVYEWGRPSGNIAALFTDREVVADHIAPATNAAGRALLQLTSRATHDATIPYAKVLHALGVRWVLQRNDVDWHYYPSPSPSRMRAFLQDEVGLHLVKTFGRLDLYELPGVSSAKVHGAGALVDIVSDTGYAAGLHAYEPGTLARLAVGRSRSYIESASASSTYAGAEAFGPGKAFDDDVNTAWVVGRERGVGEEMVGTLRRPTVLRTVTIQARLNGIDTFPKLVTLTAAGVERVVRIGGDGTGTADFGGVAASELRVRVDDVRRGGGDNVGIAEVAIEGARNDWVLPSVGAIDGSLPFAVLDYAADPLSTRLLQSAGVGFSEAEVEVALDPSTPDVVVADHIGLRDVDAVRATSRFRGDVKASPYLAFDGDPRTEWISNSPVAIGEELLIDFASPRQIGSIALTARSAPPPVPVTIEVLVDGVPIRRQVLPGGDSARAVVTINRTGVSLAVRVVDVGAHDQEFRFGLSEVEIPGLTREPVPLAPPSLRLSDTDIDFEADSANAFADAVANGSVTFRARFAPLSGKLRVVTRQVPAWSLQRATLSGGGSEDDARLKPFDTEGSGDLVRTTESVRTRFVTLAETSDPLWRLEGKGPSERINGVSGYAQGWVVGEPSQLVFRFGSVISALDWLVLSSMAFVLMSVVAIFVARAGAPASPDRTGATRVHPAAVLSLAMAVVVLVASAGAVAVGLAMLSEELAKWAYYLFALGAISSWVTARRTTSPEER